MAFLYPSHFFPEFKFNMSFPCNSFFPKGTEHFSTKGFYKVGTENYAFDGILAVISDGGLYRASPSSLNSRKSNGTKTLSFYDFDQDAYRRVALAICGRTDRHAVEESETDDEFLTRFVRTLWMFGMIPFFAL